jgi:enhancing lycopene biosynthesis protein 2
MHRTVCRLGSLPVAVLLSGCGVYDGSEIHESVSTLVALDKHQQTYKIFAPDTTQGDVINHSKGALAQETRSALAEAGRIARGNIQPLSELNPAQFKSLVMPGGFGVMKTLSNFAFKGKEGAIRGDVKSAILAFHQAKKPIGAACIAPILVAASLGTTSGGPGVKITLGDAKGDAHDLATFLGAQSVTVGKLGVCVDPHQLVVSTPAYMYEVGPSTVFTGIDRLIQVLLKMSDSNEAELNRLIGTRFNGLFSPEDLHPKH